MFVLTRPIIDFNANSPVSDTPRVIEDKVRFIAEELGINTDTLAIFVQREQSVTLYKNLKDSLSYLPSPATLQSKDIPVTYWDIKLYRKNVRMPFNPGENLDELSIFNLSLQDDGKIFRIKSNQRYADASFYEGDSLPEISESIVQNVLGFSLSNYTLDARIDTTILTESVEQVRQLNTTSSKIKEERFKFTWRKVDLSQAGPLKIYVELKPVVRTNEFGTIRQGVSIQSVSTVYINEIIEQQPSKENPMVEAFYFFISLLSLVGLVVAVSVRQILKNMVEWKRGFIMLFLAIVIIGSWRTFYYFQSQFWILNGPASITYLFNTLLYALLLGVFTALAYMGWDSLARQQKHKQLPIFDAIWQGKLFFKETGIAIIYGYTIAGVLVGVLAVGLLGLNLSFHQYNSQFGYTEATSVLPVLTVPLNALGVSVFGLIAHFGLTSAFFQDVFKKQWLNVAFTFVFASFFLSGVGRFFGTEGSFFNDMLLYLLLIIPIYMAYKQLGFFSVTIAWGVFAMIVFMSPFFNTSSSSIIIQFLILTGILLLPLIFGFIAANFGDSLADERGYIPEYEEKISRQLRFEKEIEIARESQFELLPVNTPELPEAMIFGFFIPSFEVGGDYYDYFLKYDEAKKPKSLAITVVDVSGKAMKAAMHAVHTSGLILSRFPTDTPEQVLSMINPFIHQKTDKKTFITGIAAEYQFDSKILSLANAGHCLPVLKRNGKATFIDTPAPKFPLGIIKQVDYKSVDIQLQAGDVVLFYSDGLPEAQNTKGKRFGFDTVLSLMEEIDTETETSAGICQYIKRKVQQFSAYQMADDTTIVALKIV